MDNIIKKPSFRSPAKSEGAYPHRNKSRSAWHGSKSTSSGKKRSMHRGAPHAPRPQSHNKVTGKIPSHGENIRIIPLGGVEEVGKNMTVIEIGQDIIVVDAGLQFRTAETPGIDYIIPNTKYLEERKDRVRAVIITHGHLDHIGAIPYVMGKIGNPPLYTRELTSIMILKRQEEFPHFKPLNIKVVEKDEKIDRK